MANRQTTPRMNVPERRSGVSGQVRSPNFSNVYQAPSISGIMKAGARLAAEYYQGEKEAAFKRFDLQASRLQLQEMEDIRVAESNAAIPEIEKGFRASLSEEFSKDNWGKQWLAERGDLFFRANANDVYRAGLAKQKELYTLQMDKTLNTFADDISTSAEDKARVLIGDAEKFIDASNLLSPAEKQKSKDNFLNLTLKKMASSNPDVAVNLLKDEEFTKGLGIDAKAQIDDIIKKQFAEIVFQRQVTEFNNEKKLSEDLEGLSTDEALRLLHENEENVSAKFYEAKEKALLSAKGINTETQAEMVSEIMLDIAAINKDDTQAYFAEANDILTKIENNYAAGYLSSPDRRRLINDVYKAQGKNINVLKEEGSGWKFWDFSYKDANEYISDNYSGQDGNRLLLDYFRAVNERDYSNDDKKAILQGLIDKTKTEKVNAAIDRAEGTLKIGFIRNGYRYIGGNPNEQNSWEKI